MTSTASNSADHGAPENTAPASAQVPVNVRVHEFLAAMSHMDDVVTEVPEGAWNSASPCQEWSAEGVLFHVVGTLSKVHDLLNVGGAYGSAPAQADSDNDASATHLWREGKLRVSEALGEADLSAQVDTPHGKQTVADALGLPTADLSVHSWDIAAATGGERELPAELLAQVRRQVGQLPEQALRRPGVFGPEVQAPDGASETDAFMAFLGRQIPGHKS